MPKKLALSPEAYTMPLLMNGLQGRMLHVPAPKGRKREFLVVYGQHTSLEHWWPLVLELNRHGTVTMPDLPGFGGMQSFHKIGEKPTLDEFADYLAAFVKLRYKSKRFTIVAIAFGFVVVTRMLQRYPDLARRVDLVISLGGLARYDDITWHRPKRILYRLGGRLLASRVPALFIRHVALHPTLLSSWYNRQKTPPVVTNEEVWLWRHNDIRTHFMTLSALMKLDNCQQTVSVPLWHISMHANKLLAHQHINQHLRVIFSDVQEVRSRLRSQTIGTISYNPLHSRLLPTKIHHALTQARALSKR